MDAKRLQRLRSDLGRFLDAVLPDLGRQGRRSWAELYLHGLLLHGRRKSAGAMAELRVAQPLDGVAQVDHPSRLVVVEPRASAVLSQQDRRIDEHLIEPVRVLPKFPGQDLGLLVGQRDRAG